LLDSLLVVAALTAILLGGALVRLLYLERRAAQLGQRLSAIARASSAPAAPIPSLRRQRPGRRRFRSIWFGRLDSARAATGNRIGLKQMVVIGFAAAAVVGIGSAAASLRPIATITLAASAAAGAPVMLLRLAQSRYQRKFLDAFPDALDLIVRAVRSGLPAPEAIELVTREVRAPVGTEFQEILNELRIGTEMEEALQRAADRIRVPDFRFFIVSVLLQRRTGGGIAETLSNLSGIIRQRKALRLKARALAAEAQASAAIIAATPFVAGVGLFLINRDLTAVLFTDPRGRLMLGIATASLVAGIAAMRALIRRNLR
jgi:tight adherence protein B